MAEGVDTSSYRLPIQPSALENADKIGAIMQNAQLRPIQVEQQQTQLDKSKLDLVNQKWGILNKELSTMAGDANINTQDVFKRMQGLLNQGLIDQKQYGEFVKQVPTDQKQIPRFLQTTLERGQENVTALNWHYGQQTNSDNGQTVTPGVSSTKPGFAGDPTRGGFKPTSAPIQKQLPVGAEGRDNRPTLPDGTPNPNFGATSYIGPQSPQNAPGTVSQPTPVNTSPLPVGPINSPALKGQSSNFGGNVLGATVEAPSPAQSVADRFPNVPRGPATGMPPGVAEAAVQTGSASGKQLADARERAANYQTDIYPLMQAIPALEKLGTKGTGPGSETLNNLKSFVLSNVPGIKESDPVFASVPTYDKAKKYLTQIATTMGSTGTNDKLAATFAANPSVGISNAAAVDVAKSIFALRNMQQAQYQEFEKLNLPDSQFAKWTARRNGELDPRAFGVNMMSPEAKEKLFTSLKSNKAEREKFERSLELAHGEKLISLSSGQ